MQVVTLGLHLDGQRATDVTNGLGTSVVGPQAFLSLLETHLGLIGIQPSRAERIVQYQGCLQSADNGSRFYSAVMAIDPLGTADTLLGWRDELHLHGWKGQSESSFNARLSDLAEVEHIAREKLGPSTGERLEAVRDMLSRRSVPIKQVHLADPLSSFPVAWQAVLGLLPCEENPPTSPSGRGLLGQLQRELVKALRGEPYETLEWIADDSIQVVQAETTVLAASWLANTWIESDDRLLIASENGAEVDSYLSAAGRARQGLKELSAFRPALQVLPLALELIWEPINFRGLVQFLTHTICPVPSFARRKLAAKVADAPGVVGTRWQSVLKEIEAHYGPEKGSGVMEAIRFWVEQPRHLQALGAPLEAVIARVRRLADFFRVRLAEPDPAKREAFHSGYAQCRACLESLMVLQTTGTTTIRRRQLERLVQQATASGSGNPLAFAEVGASPAIHHPGAAIAQAEHVVWWRLSAPPTTRLDPWTRLEREALAASGVLIPSADARLEREAMEWVRPILAAKQRLTLVLPPAGAEVHPVWQMINAMVADPFVFQIERSLTEGSEGMRAVQVVALPSRRRWWSLPDDIKVAPRQRESFSSLELLLFNPYAWLLRYPAALRPSRTIDLGNDFRLLGTLAHSLAERYFKFPSALAMDDAMFRAWFGPAFETLIDEEGAILRMPGKGASLEKFRHKLLGAMLELRKQLRESHIVSVEPEVEVSGRYSGGEIAGYVDLIATKATGEQAIIDMKWAGLTKYSEKLRLNAHLQLSIYAELLRQKSGSPLAVSYYIFDRSRFLAPGNEYFPGAAAIPSQNGENVAHLWQRLEKTIAWRRDQLRAGLIEVALEGIEATEASIPPLDGMEMTYLNEDYNEYLALAGWET